jgi:hypothetical protein
MYLRNLQRYESRLIYLRNNVHQVHRRHNLPNTALNRVPEVVLAARLKHGHAVTGLSCVTHDRLGRFQAVGFGHRVDIAVVVGPDRVVFYYPFFCCPVLWWNYLGS